MSEIRYANGLDLENNEYWVRPSTSGLGMTEVEAISYIERHGDYPWRLSDKTRELFRNRVQWLKESAARADTSADQSAP